VTSAISLSCAPSGVSVPTRIFGDRDGAGLVVGSARTNKRSQSFWICFFVLLSAAQAEAQVTPRPISQRIMTLEDLQGIDGPEANTIALSPDGRTLAIESKRELSLVRTSNAKLIATLGEGTIPIWSPKGDFVAFYSSRSGNLQLWLWSEVSSSLKMLTNVPGGIDPDPTTRMQGTVSDAFIFSWSPDGEKIAFSSRVSVGGAVNEGGRPLVLTNATPAAWTCAGVYLSGSPGIPSSKDARSFSVNPLIPGITNFSQIFVADRRTATVDRLSSGDRNYFHPAWSPDGKTILSAALEVAGGFTSFEHAARQAVARGRGGEIRAIASDGRSDRVIYRGSKILSRPKWSVHGSRCSFLSAESMSGAPELNWGSCSGDAAFHQPVRLVGMTMGYDWISETVIRLYYYGPSGPRLSTLAVTDPTATPRKRADRDWPVAAWSGTSGGALAWVGRNGEIWLKRGAKSSPVQIKRATNVATAMLGREISISWTNSRGDRLTGGVLLPPGHDPQKRYPVIVDAYPLNTSGWNTAWGGNHAWASQGYVVFKPGARAPHAWMNGGGQAAFREAAKGPSGWAVAYDDVMSGINQLVSSGMADADRMCLFGDSNGGGLAVYLLTVTDRFRCAVVMSPVAVDWVRDALTITDPLSIEELAGKIDVYKDTDAFVALSPVLDMDRVTTPILIGVGDEDGPLNAIEIFNGARHAGVDVTLVRYPGQGHIIFGAALRDFWKREMAFFAKHLQTSEHGKDHHRAQSITR
jgi:dipeptidyl aminopeptidase/acylaminoacyl peptidase